MGKIALYKWVNPKMSTIVELIELVLWRSFWWNDYIANTEFLEGQA